MDRIELFRYNGTWFAKFSNPETKKLFGTDTIPTSFTARAPYKTVVQAIQKLNPDSEVYATNRQV